MFHDLKEKCKLMPIKIRMMLKFRYKMELKGRDNLTMYQVIQPLSELLVGVWLNNLFRYPQLLANDPVNHEIFVMSHHIFEHLMCLRHLRTNFDGLVDVSKVNEFIDCET